MNIHNIEENIEFDRMLNGYYNKSALLDVLSCCIEIFTSKTIKKKNTYMRTLCFVCFYITELSKGFDE